MPNSTQNQIVDFLDSLKLKNFSIHTRKAYSLLLHHSLFMKSGFSEKSLSKFIASIDHLALSSKKIYLSKLKVFLSHYEPKLAPLIIIPNPPKILPKNVPSIDQIKTILDKPNLLTFLGLRDKAVLETLYATGIRASELIHLKIDDLDTSQMTLRIIQGKNRKDRLLPISAKAVSALSDYLLMVRPSNLKSDLLFLSTLSRPLTNAALNQLLKRYGPFSPHAYRHAFATHLAQRGMPQTAIQRLLGHAQLDTTAVYTHLTIADLKKQYKKTHPRDHWKRDL